jgi:hypothetical protein
MNQKIGHQPTVTVLGLKTETLNTMASISHTFDKSLKNYKEVVMKIKSLLSSFSLSVEKFVDLVSLQNYEVIMKRKIKKIFFSYEVNPDDWIPKTVIKMPKGIIKTNFKEVF